MPKIYLPAKIRSGALLLTGIAFFALLGAYLSKYNEGEPHIDAGYHPTPVSFWIVLGVLGLVALLALTREAVRSRGRQVKARESRQVRPKRLA